MSSEAMGYACPVAFKRACETKKTKKGLLRGEFISRTINSFYQRSETQ